jgi:hypothetical protein
MSISRTKLFFFDSKKVLKTVDKQTRQVFSKFGSFVRQTARGLIRKGKKPSKPGKPPHGHGPQLLKRFLFFSWEPTTRSVVIGPAKLNGTIGSAPEALEKGKRTKIVSTRNHQRVKRTATIRPRPFMAPAVAKELKTLPSKWTKSVRSS